MHNYRLAYYLKRLEQEHALAATAGCPKSAAVHRDLASRYAQLLPPADVDLASQSFQASSSRGEGDQLTAP